MAMMDVLLLVASVLVALGWVSPKLFEKIQQLLENLPAPIDTSPDQPVEPSDLGSRVASLLNICNGLDKAKDKSVIAYLLNTVLPRIAAGRDLGDLVREETDDTK